MYTVTIPTPTLAKRPMLPKNIRNGSAINDPGGKGPRGISATSTPGKNQRPAGLVEHPQPQVKTSGDAKNRGEHRYRFARRIQPPGDFPTDAHEADSLDLGREATEIDLLEVAVKTCGRQFVPLAPLASRCWLARNRWETSP